MKARRKTWRRCQGAAETPPLTWRALNSFKLIAGALALMR